MAGNSAVRKETEGENASRYSGIYGCSAEGELRGPDPDRAARTAHRVDFSAGERVHLMMEDV
jgi:hypothetical protein